MFSLLLKARSLLLPIGVLLQLVNHTVVLIITCGCEIWRSENLDVVEKLQLLLCLNIIILNVNKCTSSNVVYVDVGPPTLVVNIKTTVVHFLSSLISFDENNRCSEISSLLYRLLLKIHVSDVYTSLWLTFVKNPLNDIGLSGIWTIPDMTETS